MAHVTFIHGISNQPAPDELLPVWCRALADAAAPVSLSDSGISSSLVYWADLMYHEPIADTSAHEGVLENTAAAIDGAGDAEMPIPSTAEEAAFIRALRGKLTTLSDAELADAEMELAEQPMVTEGAQAALERVPLPWFIKRPMMKAFLRDVHHYLFDVEFAPGGRPPVHIRQTIRRRFTAAVCAPAVSRPHVVVAHSMGTVIAYDCLKRVADCDKIDGLITIGSPLGLDEIQDKLQPGWSREDGFPGTSLIGRWVNLFDRLDPVAGFDAQLANDYRRGGLGQIEDIVIQNPGVWRHSATKYLRQPRFTAALREMLQL